uniref:Uncharacterized protein n=1 Tax=Helianthus annuus TaxID=4232 RepID=A0A251TD22_HELAN
MIQVDSPSLSSYISTLIPFVTWFKFPVLDIFATILVDIACMLCSMANVLYSSD